MFLARNNPTAPTTPSFTLFTEAGCLALGKVDPDGFAGTDLDALKAKLGQPVVLSDHTLNLLVAQFGRPTGGQVFTNLEETEYLLAIGSVVVELDPTNEPELLGLMSRFGTAMKLGPENFAVLLSVAVGP